MNTTQQPEALRLADKYEIEGFLGDHRFAQDHWCRQAAAELRRQHTRIAELEAACIAYASELKPDADGDPDVGNIHANIRALKAEIGKLQQQLIAEAKKTAEEKLRADQLDKQHTMQSRMHAEAVQRIQQGLEQFIEQVGDVHFQRCRVGSKEGAIRWDIEFGHYGAEVRGKTLQDAITKAIAAQAK